MSWLERPRRALRMGPAALLAVGLLLAGCDERQESAMEPSSTKTEATANLADRSDKQRNAVDLGPGASVQGAIGTRSVSVFGSTATSIPFAPEPGPFANRGPVCDDCVSVGLPIGFSFTFFENSYTTFSLSSNGFIQFGGSPSDGCCSGGRIPSADGINNIIAATWTDLYPAGSGMITFETRGRAPSRYLVVDFLNVQWCCEDEAGNNRVTTQIILYEGSNIIEIHTAWQSVGHTYTQGIENAAGTEASFLPGRVASNYGLINDAVRFTTSPSWVSRAPLPSARRGLALWDVNGLLFAMGGANSAGTAVRSVQAYNPSTNTWTTKAQLPAARQTGNGAGEINKIIYLAGGHDAAGALTRTLYAYNSGTNTWSTKTQMPIYSSCGGTAVFSGRLYVFSGCTRSSTGSQVAAGRLHRYNPATNTWAALPSAPVPHFQPVVTVTGGKLYVIGGNNGSGVATGRVDVYDPATNSWSVRTAMPTARVGAAGVAIGGKIYIMGGRNGTTYLNTVEVYDPLSNSWTTRAAMPTARAAFGVAGISGFLYAVGGRNASTTALRTNERFAP